MGVCWKFLRLCSVVCSWVVGRMRECPACRVSCQCAVGAVPVLPGSVACVPGAVCHCLDAVLVQFGLCAAKVLASVAQCCLCAVPVWPGSVACVPGAVCHCCCCLGAVLSCVGLSGVARCCRRCLNDVLTVFACERAGVACLSCRTLSRVLV